MSTETPTRGTPASVPEAPSGEPEVRDLPEPEALRRLIGPSVILVGVGIASGEYILYPYIAAQAGLVFLWAAVVGVLYDRDEHGELLHVFTQTIADRLFFEVVQRVGPYDGYGAANSPVRLAAQRRAAAAAGAV